MTQVKYVDTQSQLADILTKGSFTKERCNKLLRLCNIMDASVLSNRRFRSFVLTREESCRNGKPKGKRFRAELQNRDQCAIWYLYRNYCDHQDRVILHLAARTHSNVMQPKQCQDDFITPKLTRTTHTHGILEQVQAPVKLLAAHRG